MNVDGLMNAINEKINAIVQEKMHDIARMIEGHMQGPQANDAAMAGLNDLSFALKTARVEVAQKSDREWELSLVYNNENSPEEQNTNIQDDMKYYFFMSKQYAVG